MRQKSVDTREAAERTGRDIRRKTRKRHSAEDKIRIVLSGLRGEESIAALCRREGIAENLYYSWSKEFLEAGRRRLAGDTERQANTGEVKDLRREMRDMKELVADLSLENRLLEKHDCRRHYPGVASAVPRSRRVRCASQSPATGQYLPATGDRRLICLISPRCTRRATPRARCATTTRRCSRWCRAPLARGADRSAS